MAKRGRPASCAAGARFGLLTSVAFVRNAGSGPNQIWLFKCDCGGERARPYSDVKRGRFADCGCRPPTQLQRAALFRQRYKVTAAGAAELAVRVEGTCDVCGEPETRLHPRTGVRQFLCVDHCHETGNVRGVLCAKCNGAEAYLRGLQNARNLVTYLERAEKLANENCT